MKPGFYEMTAQAYHQQAGIDTPALSASIAKILDAKSPAHAYHCHPRLGGGRFETSDSMEFGTLFHAVALGQMTNVAIGDFETWASKDAKAFKAAAEAAGQIPVKRSKMGVVNAMAAAFARQVANSDTRGFYAEGTLTEAAAIWAHGDVVCKTLFDRVNVETGLIYDIKTTTDASPDACERKIVAMGYDIQAEFYRMALESVYPALEGRTRFVFLFVETSAPYVMTPFELSTMSAAIGRTKVLKAIDKWRECLLFDSWPGYSTEILQIEPKPWAMAEALAEETE
jgi:hypothetical protein